MGLTPPDCHEDRDSTCTQDRPAELPVVELDEESSDSEDSDAADEDALGGRANCTMHDTTCHTHTTHKTVWGGPSASGFDSPAHHPSGCAAKPKTSSWVRPFTARSFISSILLCLLMVGLWHCGRTGVGEYLTSCTAIAVRLWDAATALSSWEPSLAYSWVNQLLQYAHLPREVFTVPGQRYLRQTEGRGGQALTISTQSVLTLQADQEPLEAAYCYLLGGMAVTTAWSALQALLLAWQGYHSATKRVYRRHYPDRRTRQITRVATLRVYRWGHLMSSSHRYRPWRLAVLVLFLLPPEAAAMARQSTTHVVEEAAQQGWAVVGSGLEAAVQQEWCETLWSHCSLTSLAIMSALMLLALLAFKLQGRVGTHQPRAASWLRQLSYARFVWLQCRKVYYMTQLLVAACTFQALAAWLEVSTWLTGRRTAPRHSVPVHAVCSAAVQVATTLGLGASLASWSYRAARTVQCGAITAYAWTCGQASTLIKIVGPALPTLDYTHMLLLLTLTGACAVAAYGHAPQVQGPLPFSAAATQAESQRFHSAIVQMEIKGQSGPVELTVRQNTLADTGAGWSYLRAKIATKLGLPLIPILCSISDE